MALVARLALRGSPLPPYLPGPLVDCVDHPPVRRPIVSRVAVAVEPGLEGRLPAAADGGRHEHGVAPHDRARVREPRDWRAPHDVLASRRVPRVGQLLPVGDPRGFMTAKRWPMARARCSRRQRPFRSPRGACDAARRDGRLDVRRQPLAAVQDHPSRDAFVGDHAEADARGIDREGVPPRPGAVVGAVLQLQRHLSSAHRPRAGHRRPPRAVQRKCSGRIEAQRERAHRQRPVRQRLPGRCRWHEQRKDEGECEQPAGDEWEPHGAYYPRSSRDS
jgi:hypothetical protein